MTEEPAERLGRSCQLLQRDRKRGRTGGHELRRKIALGKIPAVPEIPTGSSGRSLCDLLPNRGGSPGTGKSSCSCCFPTELALPFALFPSWMERNWMEPICSTLCLVLSCLSVGKSIGERRQITAPLLPVGPVLPSPGSIVTNPAVPCHWSSSGPFIYIYI